MAAHLIVPAGLVKVKMMPAGTPSTKLYHYTTVEVYKGILNSGRVRASNGLEDANFGDGVYMTSKSPQTHSMPEISSNNFDEKVQVWKSQELLDKVIVALEFEFFEGEAKEKSTDRDIWLYPDDDLVLEDFFTGSIYVGGLDGYSAAGEWYMEAAI